MFVDGGRGTRVGTDGTGLMNVWRQQLMQFKNVSVEVSNAIIAQYPSPRLLYDVRIGFPALLFFTDYISMLNCYRFIHEQLVVLFVVQCW